MFTRLLCGVYYNVSQHRVVRLTARMYCVLCASFCTQYSLRVFRIAIVTNNIVLLLRCLLILASYLIIVMINFVYEGEYFYKFRRKLAKFDNVLNCKPADNLKCSTLCFIILLSQRLVSQGILLMSLGSLTFTGHAILCTSTVTRFAITSSNFTKIIMFECLYQRMRLLRELFKRNLSVARRFEDGEYVMKENLRKCMDTYKKLLHTLHGSNIPMKAMVNYISLYLFN